MKKKLKSMFILSLPYVVTIFLPIISTIFLSRAVINNFQEKIITDKRKNIEVSCDRFLKKIDAIERLMYTIAKSDEMRQYISLSKAEVGHSTSKYLAVRDMLGSLMIDSNISAIYYYDIKEGRIITNDASYGEAKSYFTHRYQLDDYTADEYVDKLKKMSRGRGYSSNMIARLDRTIVEVIEYRMAVPIELTSALKGQLVMVLNVSELFDDFEEMLGVDGELYVYDNSDNLIYSNGDRYEKLLDVTEEITLKQITVGQEIVWGMVCDLDNSNWKVKAYVPNPLGEIDNEWINFYVILWGIIPVVVSIVLSVIFTVKNYREICEILNLFIGHGKTWDSGKQGIKEVGYGNIREQINKLMCENDDFRNRINVFEQSHKYEILDKLIRNTYNQEKIAEDLKKAKLNIVDGKCVVLCIRYRSSEYRTMVMEDVNIKDFVRKLLYQLIEKTVEIFDTSARETICIFSLGEEDDFDIMMNDIISRINVEIVYNYGIELEIGIGNVVESLLVVNDSYLQAKEVIGYNETYGSNIRMYSELEKKDDICYYPSEFDEKIYNYMIIGKSEEAKNVVQIIYKENFVKQKNLSGKAAELIKERLENTICSLVKKSNIVLDEIKVKFGSIYDPKSYFDGIFELIDVISEELCSRKKFNQNQSAIKIMNYVKENYCNSDISLKQISVTFGFNEHYISDLFKNVYGVKISVFIEKMRIEKACEKIKSGNYKIHDIAQEVGYTSDVSFRRAFKKVTGVTPSEYKDI